MKNDEAIAALREAFGVIDVTTEAPPVGAFARLPEVLAETRRRGGVDGSWNDPVELVETLAVADSAGVVEALDRAVESGYAWAPCDRCGEVTLRPRGKAGRTASGALSKAKPAPVACRMSHERIDGAIVRCPGKHVVA